MPRMRCGIRPATPARKMAILLHFNQTTRHMQDHSRGGPGTINRWEFKFMPEAPASGYATSLRRGSRESNPKLRTAPAGLTRVAVQLMNTRLELSESFHYT